jgi:signal transduction histidine kinase
MQRLANFICDNMEQILLEWETFARDLHIGDAEMDVPALRDHAEQMLRAFAIDLETPQTANEQALKAKGGSDAKPSGPPTAAQQHGAGRALSGFTVAQMVSEFRALRACVIRLWLREQPDVTSMDLQDMIRFNEAIDQAIAESITRYASDVAESKERFIAILGHDLVTPLNAIITSSWFMLDTGALTEPHVTLLRTIASSAGRMNHMVSDLLDFTRMRFGEQIPLDPRPTDIRELMNDLASEVAASHPAPTLQVEISGDVRGVWDPERLAQVLTNLVTNAVQHGSDKSPVRVVVHGEPTEVVIAVHNEGPIIPKQQLPQLFVPMKPSASGGGRERRHLGLGLYIVHAIVVSHGGSIDVHSSKDRGTTFTVYLPRTSERESEAALDG